MKILMVSAEVAPMIKVGGLADVVGALPKALQALGHDVRIIMPKYAVIDTHHYPSARQWANLPVRWDGRDLLATVDEGRLPNTPVPVYYLDCPPAFSDLDVLHGLAGVYANSSDPVLVRAELRRFVFFSWAVASILPEIPWQPDIIHCHDWHTAGLPVFSQIHGHAAPTVLTIHNLQNQGKWPPAELLSWVGLETTSHPQFSLHDRENNFNLLQQGITSATIVNTVSPTYAKEILTPEYGESLDPDLRRRHDGVLGILNGIDNEVFNPERDEHIFRQYSLATVKEGKAANKSALQQQLDLPVDATLPMFVAVTRLTAQKGLELLLQHLPSLIQQPLQIVILGTGHPDVERGLKEISAKYPHKLRIIIGFDVVLGQKMYSGGDYFLMPSHFEPCGLGQLMAMRYGTLPIVRATGGLKDTVVDVVDEPNRGTGFVFTEFTAEALEAKLFQALKLFHQPAAFDQARQRAMSQDFSWTSSARQYLQLYVQAQNTKIRSK